MGELHANHSWGPERHERQRISTAASERRGSRQRKSGPHWLHYQKTREMSCVAAPSSGHGKAEEPRVALHGTNSMGGAAGVRRRQENGFVAWERLGGVQPVLSCDRPRARNAQVVVSRDWRRGADGRGSEGGENGWAGSRDGRQTRCVRKDERLVTSL